MRDVYVKLHFTTVDHISNSKITIRCRYQDFILTKENENSKEKFYIEIFHYSTPINKYQIDKDSYINICNFITNSLSICMMDSDT